MFRNSQFQPRLLSRPSIVRSARALTCLTLSAIFASSLSAQQVASEPTDAWLAFFQAHSRMLDNANQRAAGNPALLPQEQNRVAKYFALPPSVHANVMPVTTLFRQNFGPVSAQQKTYRENVQANRQVASRQQFLSMWMQREQV